MSKFQELLDSLTDEDGIRTDFVDAARAAYDEDIAELTTTHAGALDELNATHSAATEQLTAAHAAEIDGVRAERYEEMQDAGNVDALPETYGDESDDEPLTIDTFWIEDK